MVARKTGLYKWYFSRKAFPYWMVLLLDCAIVMFSQILVFFIMSVGIFRGHPWTVAFGVAITVAVFVIFFRLFHTYRGFVRFSSFSDLLRIASCTAFASATVWAIALLLKKTGIMPLFFRGETGAALLWIFTTACMCLVRILVKYAYDSYRISSDSVPAFIYGAQAGAVSLCKAIRSQEEVHYDLRGFIDPDGNNIDWLMGEKVYPESSDIIKTMKDAGVKVLLVSPLQTEHFTQEEALIGELIDADIKIMMFSAEQEWDGKSPLSHTQLHEVKIEDLLPRQKIEVDMDAIGELLTGKRILITGAAGSIGSEMVRSIAAFKPAEMILIDQAETPMHDLRMMMRRDYPGIEAVTMVASITNSERMEDIFRVHKPEYVFHAAAYKHVPMMEDNPAEAVQNNICGTRIIADLAVKYGTKKFVMISTDKAVNPTNVMGCSKRICEIYCQSLNKAIESGEVKGVTQFVTTRFGNVLGSNGSVIPIFREQIAAGGPVTVTHPDIVRYFMLIPEACKLVLEAGTMGKGGEIFVFDMGKPVKIVDLAKRMIRLSGAKDIEIEFTGLREGEKLYEEVLADEETTKPTVHPKIKIAAVREYPYADICAAEDRLVEASHTYDDMAIVKVMKEIVPEYKSQESKYCVLDQPAAGIQA